MLIYRTLLLIDVYKTIKDKRQVHANKQRAMTERAGPTDQPADSPAVGVDSAVIFYAAVFPKILLEHLLLRNCSNMAGLNLQMD